MSMSPRVGEDNGTPEEDESAIGDSPPGNGERKEFDWFPTDH